MGGFLSLHRNHMMRILLRMDFPFKCVCVDCTVLNLRQNYKCDTLNRLNRFFEQSFSNKLNRC